VKRFALGLLSLAAVALSVLAAGAAGASSGQVLPSSFCSKVDSSGSGAPDYLIVSDLALQNPDRVATKMVAAIRFVLAQHGFKAGRYSVGYQSCDDSTAQNPQGDLAKCAANAKAYAATQSVIGVIGAWYSACSGAELPILGSSKTGSLALVSPTNTQPGLTHASGGSAPGEPGRYYPTERRNFARLVAPDDFQGIAAVLLARQLRLRSVFVLDDAESYGLDVAVGFKRAARSLGLRLAGSASWDVSQSNFDNLARRVARVRPAAVLLGGFACPHCGVLIKELRKRIPTARLIAPDGFLPIKLLVKAVGSSANGMFVIEPGLPPSRFGALGQKLQQKFGASSAENGGAPVAGQAVEILLAALARSDGSRSSVTSHVLADPVHGGILGDFSFDRNGDLTPSSVTIHRVRRGGETIDRVIRVPSRLVR
jgi:branched-chain amino acid transport system substrate-binding protein